MCPVACLRYVSQKHRYCCSGSTGVGPSIKYGILHNYGTCRCKHRPQPETQGPVTHYLSPGCWQRANGCQRPLGIATRRCPMSRCSFTSTSVDFPNQCGDIQSSTNLGSSFHSCEGPVTRRVSALAKEKRIQTYNRKPKPQVAWMDSTAHPYPGKK